MLRRHLLAAALVMIAGSSSLAQSALDSQTFDSNGVKIRYVDVGRGDPVVLVHGFSSDLDANWSRTRILETLARDFRVIAFDCRGHGESGKPHEAASYGVQMVEDITRLLDHLDIRQAHIVGYSMGGAITGKFVALHPDRVRTATFGGSSPRIGAGGQSERDAEELAASLESGKGMRPLILRLSPPNEPKPSEAEIEQQSRMILGRNDPLALAAVQRGNHEQTVTVAQVRAMQVPMLAIVGSADPMAAGVRVFKQLVPSLQVVTIAGATHSGPRGAPGRPEFVAAVHDFIAAHRQTTSAR